MLVTSRMASTISMILDESLFMDAMQTSPPREDERNESQVWRLGV
jgi:hypothetical protein